MSTTQGPPLGPTYPELHWQSLMPVLPGGDCELVGQDAQALDEMAPVAVEYVPPAQFMQGPLPIVLLCVPAGQARHKPSPEIWYPTIHRQAAAPTGDCELSGQLKHVVAP